MPIDFSAPPKPLFSYRKYWAHRFGPAPFLPMSRAEMDQLGWDECDIILVTGDAYIDHPSFGMALVGRLLEAQGFRVGIISQPDWHSAEDFRRLHVTYGHAIDGRLVRQVKPSVVVVELIERNLRGLSQPNLHLDQVCR